MGPRLVGGKKRPKFFERKKLSSFFVGKNCLNSFKRGVAVVVVAAVGVSVSVVDVVGIVGVVSVVGVVGDVGVVNVVGDVSVVGVVDVVVSIEVGEVTIYSIGFHHY